MKKIGILTFQRTTNYGAQYQNYALQEYLKKYKDLDVSVIDYDNNTVNGIERKLKLNDQRNIKDIVKYLKNGRKKIEKWNRFESFRKEHINMSDFFDKSNINLSRDKYDYYLVGSDQVWNPYITGNDFNYFLSFENNKDKKYSYAASFGNYDYSIEIKESMKKYLSDFKRIAVREESAVDFLKSINVNESTAVIDPTFLLTQNEWNNSLKLCDSDNKYILVYMIDDSSKNIKKIKELAKNEKLKIIYINNDFFNVVGVKNIRDCSPIQFLNYLKMSKYVITGSFHAICMSLIMQKDFYYILNKKLKRNSRIIDLMNDLNISGHDITDTLINTNKKLNYDKINDLLNKKISYSKNILNEYYREWINNE